MKPYYVSIEYILKRDGKTCYCMTWFDENFHIGPRVRGQLFVVDNLEFEQLTKDSSYQLVDNSDIGYKLAKKQQEKYLTKS